MVYYRYFKVETSRKSNPCEKKLLDLFYKGADPPNTCFDPVYLLYINGLSRNTACKGFFVKAVFESSITRIPLLDNKTHKQMQRLLQEPYRLKKKTLVTWKTVQKEGSTRCCSMRWSCDGARRFRLGGLGRDMGRRWQKFTEAFATSMYMYLWSCK